MSSRNENWSRECEQEKYKRIKRICSACFQTKNAKGQWWVNDIAYADACHTFWCLHFLYMSRLSLVLPLCGCVFVIVSLFLSEFLIAIFFSSSVNLFTSIHFTRRLDSSICTNFDFMRRYVGCLKMNVISAKIYIH